MEYTINVEDNGNKNFETVGNLISELERWRKWAKENDRWDEFLDMKINLSLCDAEGITIDGDACLNAGWCGERFLLVGNVQSVYR